MTLALSALLLLAALGYAVWAWSRGRRALPPSLPMRRAPEAHLQAECQRLEDVATTTADIAEEALAQIAAARGPGPSLPVIPDEVPAQ